MTPDCLARLAADGFAVVPDAVPDADLAAVADALEPLLAGLGRGRGGVRDALAVPAVRALAAGPLRAWAEPVLGRDCVAVSATVFDKTPGRNWKVPFHQDVTIKVRERRDVPGIDTWWERDGVPHCWPPAGVLDGMLAVRVHLDDCGADNGPVRVLPGSHRGGVLTAAAVDAWPRGGEALCAVGRGGVLLMRPLLLHASSAATVPARRRVVHVEFAAPELPGGLRWHAAAESES